MFGKKRTFPPGTFIPTSSRVNVILHLSLACSLLLWCLFFPFFGDVFENRQEKALFESLTGQTTLLERINEGEEREKTAELLFRNRERFNALPLSQRQQIERHHAQRLQKNNDSFITKCTRGCSLLLITLPLYLKGWLLLSLIVPIFLLMRIEGSQMAVWLLPLLACLFAIDNTRHGSPIPAAPDAHLYPSEKHLLQEVLKEQPAQKVFEQMEQLKRGWEQFLLSNWGSSLEEAEYRFHLARLEAIYTTDTAFPPPFQSYQSPFILLIFFVWNLFLALFMNRKRAFFP